MLGMNRPQLQCLFGGVAVAATVTLPTNSSNPATVQCIAPALSEFAVMYNVTGSFTVSLQFRMVVNATSATFVASASNSRVVIAPQNGSDASSFGVGPSAVSFDPATQSVIVPFNVHGVVAVAINYSQQYTALVPHELSFRYAALTETAQCGCSESPGSVADSCGVCGGDGSFVDCEGTCFGSAFFDDCIVCVGGMTGKVKNYLMDCNGVCQPPGSPGCGYVPQPAPSVAGDDGSWTLTIVIIVALIACSLVLLMLIGYFVISRAIRLRNYDDAVAEFLAQEVRIVRPGLSDQAMALHAAIPAPKTDGEPENCTVCMEPMAPGQPCRQLQPCRHIFHVECADTWLGRSTVCPMCRADLRTEDERATANAALAQAAARFEQRTGMQPRMPPDVAAAVAAMASGPPGAGGAQNPASLTTSERDRVSTVIELSPLGLPLSAGSSRPPDSTGLVSHTPRTPLGSARARQSPLGTGGGGAVLVSSSRPTNRVITPTTISVLGSVHSDGEYASREEDSQPRVPRYSNPIAPLPRQVGHAGNAVGRLNDACTDTPLMRHLL